MGSLMIASVNEFFGTYLRNNRITDYEIMILGKDIITGNQENDDGKVYYTSSFEHVSFCPVVSPAAYVEQYAYGLNPTEFAEMYDRQLRTPESMPSILN